METFVKAKKIWTKEFKEEKLDGIWKAFIKASPKTKEEWEAFGKKNGAIKWMKKHQNFIHPETDVEDDSVGLEPDSIKEYLEYYNVDGLEKIFKLLNLNIEKLSSYIDEDGFVNWESVWSNKVKRFFSSETSFNELLGKIVINLYEYNISDFDIETIKYLGKNPETIEIIRNLDLKPPYQIEMFDEESFLETRKELWKHVTKRIPHSKEMLYANPYNFSPKILFKIEKIFGSKQVAKLDKKDQKRVVKLINNFGINIIHLPDEINKEEIDNLSLNINGNELKEVIQLKDLSSDLSLNEFLNYTRTLQIFKGRVNLKLNKHKEVLTFLTNSGLLNNINKVDVLQNININFIWYLQRYGAPATSITNLIKLYEENKNNYLTVPTFKGKINSYTLQMIPKNNLLGLVAGYATDCCQIWNGVGHQCLVKGYEHPDSTFFIVTKKNKIYAQSWVWTKNTKYGTIAVMDSVEVLGKNLDKSVDILKAYQEAAEILYEKGYYAVLCGADGNTMPEGLDKLGEFIDSDKMHKYQLNMPYCNTYSDTKNGMILIKGDLKNEAKNYRFI